MKCYRWTLGIFFCLVLMLEGCKKKEETEIVETCSGEDCFVQTVSTFAGSGASTSLDGNGLDAAFKDPAGMVIDENGTMYISESHRIRKVTASGEVSTIAGIGVSGAVDDTGAAARFNFPIGLALDASGNIYVADQNNHKIRKITPAGVVTTVAGSGTSGYTEGNGTAASFASPCGITIDASGNLYVADQGNRVIRKITPAGDVTTFAGTGANGSADGAATVASFSMPYAITMDASGNFWVGDFLGNKIRKITAAGEVSTLAGSGNSGMENGSGVNASFDGIAGISVDAGGNILVTDFHNHSIRKVTPSGKVSTYAGTGSLGDENGNGKSAKFENPIGIAAFSGDIFVVDFENNKIKKIERKHK